MTEAAKRKLLLLEIPRDELALRMLAAAIGASPPSGLTVTEALDDAERLSPGMAANFRRQADAAVLFFHEYIEAGRQPS